MATNPLDHGWGHLMDGKEPRACKVRLAKIYKLPNETMMDVMNQLKLLTDKDMEDFKRWFAEAGYPCT